MSTNEGIYLKVGPVAYTSRCDRPPHSPLLYPPARLQDPEDVVSEKPRVPATTEPPMKHSPMDMQPSVDSSNGIALSATIISQQPRAEPRPEAEPQMSLRGGRIVCAFVCCDGACRFNRSCC
ncbi:hypothetical protein B0I35DRAFT_424932 [Stachybotrys elegans]|uniref:Uncharacterized protein n=1 Tax=Stachybotrys elegans TaxID=80388 RepID=A0A8K0SXJ8_9HYPO|nr:hypothetical protein B0I35DRAFT_424932 [Stachybotrys elegans]